MSAPTPGDLARWAFWVHFRKLFRGDTPERMAAFSRLWPAQYLAAGPSRALMAEELRLCFPEQDTDALVKEAYRVAFRVHAEELLMGSLSPETCPNYMAWDDLHNLQAGFDRKKGVLLLYPHAGNFMMMIAALSYAGFRYTQFAARGLAPVEVAQDNPEVFGHNRFRLEARTARHDAEDRLPATFYAGKPAKPHLMGCLSRNEIVGIAFEGRLGKSFRHVPFLNRHALLAPGPFHMALESGASIVPAICYCPADGPNRTRFGEPIVPEGPVERLMDRYLEFIQPWLHAHAAGYGIWLLHCRQRRAVDDHPLFTDYAPDDRWKKYLTG